MTNTENLYSNIRIHVESHYPMLYFVTFEEQYADELIRKLANEDNRKVIEWDFARGEVDFKNKRQLKKCELSETLENWLVHEDLTNHFLIIKDAHLVIKENSLVVARLKALAQKILHDAESNATVIFVSSQACIPPELEKFITLFDLPLPDESAINGIIKSFVNRLGEENINTKDLNDLTLAFRGLSEHEITQLLHRGYQQDGHVGSEDVELVLREKEQIIKKSGILDMVSAVEQFDNVGGLSNLKMWLKQKADVLHNLNEAKAFGVEAPKGVMIVGMPGCGKSLTAKATASLFKLPLLRLDVGSLMGKYVGESESNMRRALKLAEAVSPCVLWVDELEKAFVGIGSGGAGSEVVTRLFGYFLTWMQDKKDAVFVLATANDISALPPELLRKGRFDEIFYVDFPNKSERENIFNIHLQKRNQNANIDVKKLAEKTDGFSGADIEAVVKEAIETAFVQNRSALTTEKLLDVVQNTHPLKEVMKHKIKEYEDKFKDLKIKAAS